MAFATLAMFSRTSVSFVLYLLFILLPSICRAQDDDGSSSDNPTASTSQPSSTSSAAAQTHTISVGLADHKFRPEITNANIGDTIEFAFYPLNHSVVRAEYEYPCIPYEMTGPGKAGFFSGFKPVDSVLAFPPTFSIEIENTDPIFFYCSAPGSCIGYGMVGVINPNTSTSVDRQSKLARDSSYMLNPGEPFPPEETSNEPATPGDNPKNNDSEDELSAGAVAGIAIAGASVAVIAALLFFFWSRTRKLKSEVDRKAEIAGVLRPVPSSTSPPGMLETGHNPSNTMPGSGVRDIHQQYLQRPLLSSPAVDPAYQHYNYNQGYNNAQGYNIPAPSYFIPQIHAPHSSPPPPQQQQQQQHQHQHQYKYDMTRSTSHPANALPPIPQQSPLKIHYALAHRSIGRAFELSPTGDYTRNMPNEHPHNHSNNPNAANNDPDMISPAPSHPHPHHRYASQPHVPATPTPTPTTATTTTAAEETIPSYYETVYRPGPKHVNGTGVGPVEMDGRAVTGEITPVRTVAAKWEEIGEKTAGGDGT